MTDHRRAENSKNNGSNKFYIKANEVIVNRVRMYANPMLIVKAMYSTFKGILQYVGLISEFKQKLVYNKENTTYM